MGNESIVISKKEYESIITTLEVIKNLDLIKELDKREEDIRKGKFITLEDLKKPKK
ncbi:MAG: hypothetical protein HY929_09020 [Euryarchaeota archaeon]|nr:hypothetical protein [Euryarchaeota archaeon]